MTTIFYLIGICFVFYELLWLLSPIEKTKKIEKLTSLLKEYKGKDWNEYSDELKSMIKNKFPSLVFLAWLFIGLLSFQWIAFLIILIFNFGFIMPLSRLFKFSILYTVLHWFNSLLGLVFGLFVVINHYHLKINLTDFVLSYFN